MQSIPLCLKEESHTIFCGVIADNRLSFLQRRQSQRPLCPLNYWLRRLITTERPPRFSRMLRKLLQTSTSLLVSRAITLRLPTLLLENITLSFEIPPPSGRSTDRLTDYPPVTDEFDFVAMWVDDHLCNLHSRRANGKVWPDGQWLGALMRISDLSSSPSCSVLYVEMSWQPRRDFVDLIHFNIEHSSEYNHYICFDKVATLGSKEAALFKKNKEGDAIKGKG